MGLEVLLSPIKRHPVDNGMVNGRKLFTQLPEAPALVEDPSDSVGISRGEARSIANVRRDVNTLYNLWIASFREGSIPLPVVVGEKEHKRGSLVDCATVHGRRAVLEAGRITESLSIRGEKGSRKGDTGPNNLNIATAIAGEIGGRISMGGYATIHGLLRDGTVITVDGDENYVNDPDGLHPLLSGTTYLVEGGQLRPVLEDQPNIQDCIDMIGGISMMQYYLEAKNTDPDPSYDDLQRVVARLQDTSVEELERDVVGLRGRLEEARNANSAALAQLRAELAPNTHGGDKDVPEITAVRKRRIVKGMISALRRGSKEAWGRIIQTVEEMKAREGEEVSAEELFAAAVASYVPTRAEMRIQIEKANAEFNVPAKTRISDNFNAMRGKSI